MAPRAASFAAGRRIRNRNNNPNGKSQSIDLNLNPNATLSPMLKKLESEVATDRAWACTSISNFVMDPIQLKSLLKAGIIPKLVSLIQDSDADVITEAIGCLHNILLMSPTMVEEYSNNSIALEFVRENGLNHIFKFIPKLSNSINEVLSTPRDVAQKVTEELTKQENKTGTRNFELSLKENCFRLTEQILSIFSILIEINTDVTKVLITNNCHRFIVNCLNPEYDIPPVVVLTGLKVLYAISEDNKYICNPLFLGELKNSVPYCLTWMLLSDTVSGIYPEQLLQGSDMRVIESLSIIPAIYSRILPYASKIDQQSFMKKKFNGKNSNIMGISDEQQADLNKEREQNEAALHTESAKIFHNIKNMVQKKLVQQTPIDSSYFVKHFNRDRSAISVMAAGCLHNILYFSIDPIRRNKIARDGGESRKQGKRCNIVAKGEIVLKKLLPLIFSVLKESMIKELSEKSIINNDATQFLNIAIEYLSNDENKVINDENKNEIMKQVSNLDKFESFIQNKQMSYELMTNIITEFSGWFSVDFTEWESNNNKKKQLKPTATKDDMEGDEEMELLSGDEMSDDDEDYESEDEEEHDEEHDDAEDKEFDVNKFEQTFNDDSVNVKNISNLKNNEENKLSEEEIARIKEIRKEERIQENETQLQCLDIIMSHCLEPSFNLLKPISLLNENENTFTDNLKMNILQSSVLFEIFKLQIRSIGFTSNVLSCLPKNIFLTKDGNLDKINTFWHTLISYSMDLSDKISSGISKLIINSNDTLLTTSSQIANDVLLTRMEILESLLNCICGFSTNIEIYNLLNLDLKETEALFFLKLLTVCVDQHQNHNNNSTIPIIKKTINVLSYLARIPRTDLLEFNRQVGDTLLTILNGNNINIDIISESLDAIYDIYADKAYYYDKPVFVDGNMCSKLEYILPQIRAQIRQIDRRKASDSRNTADIALVNLRAFIKYKKSE